MAKFTPNFNLKKPEQTDFYNVDDFNENADAIDEELQNRKVAHEEAARDISALQNPEFEDYSGENAEVPDTRAAVAGITSKKSIFKTFSNIKAALMGLVTLGEMRALLVNNGLCTEAGKYFLDAAYGRTLTDQVAQQNRDLAKFYSLDADIQIPEGADLNDYTTPGNYLCASMDISKTLKNNPFTAGGFVLRVERVTGGLTSNYAKQRIAANSSSSTEFWRNRVGAIWKDWASVATSQDLSTISVDAKQYFIAPPSEGAWIRKCANVVSLNFSGNINMEFPDKSNTIIANLPGPYRPQTVTFGMLLAYPTRNAEGEITQQAYNLVLQVRSDGVVRADNWFGQSVAASRYVLGNITYITA